MAQIKIDPREIPRGYFALDKIITQLWQQNKSVIDVGAGRGECAQIFAEAGFDTTAVDLQPAPPGVPWHHLQTDFMQLRKRPELHNSFDVVWCCHMLEHTQNLHAAIELIFNLCKPDGLVAVTVPPAKAEVVGGHYNLFTPGHLSYNIAAAGWRTDQATIASYGYNISLLTKPLRVPKEMLANLRHDAGDIETLAPFMYGHPHRPMRQGTNSWNVGHKFTDQERR